jgi:hypothetical protein
LGDVFLNVTMLSYMYEQEGAFSVADALDAVTEKLIRRHPHVFGQTDGFAGPIRRPEPIPPRRSSLSGTS